MNEFLWLSLGAGISAAICWMWAQRRINSLQTRAITAESTLEAERNARTELAQLETQMREAFATLSQEALRSTGQDALNRIESTLHSRQELAQSQLSGLIDPLKTTLAEYRQHLQEIERQRQQAYGGIDQHLKEIASNNQLLRQETTRLITALRQPHVRGRWGELQLRRVVELAGMSDYCDFLEQQTSTTEEHKRLRPDLQVRLPNQRCIVVDSKVPLEAYLAAHEATDEIQRTEKLKHHAKQVREHIKTLASKAYSNSIDGSYDFIVLFIPGEVFYSAALQHDSELLEYAFGQKIILANPGTLIGLLKAVALGWSEARLTKNAQEIQQLGSELYKRLYKLTEYLNTLGASLDKTTEAYNATISSLENRVLGTARQLHNLDIGDDEIATPAEREIQTRRISKPELLTEADTSEEYQGAQQ